jgi:hypothetical protein
MHKNQRAPNSGLSLTLDLPKKKGFSPCRKLTTNSIQMQTKIVGWLGKEKGSAGLSQRCRWARRRGEPVRVTLSQDNSATVRCTRA